eukprot:765999-Pyramimonas_sp.AAC.1
MPSVPMRTGNRPECARGALLSHSRCKMGEHPEVAPRRSVLPQCRRPKRQRLALYSRMPMLTRRWADTIRPASRVRSVDYG